MAQKGKMMLPEMVIDKVEYEEAVANIQAVKWEMIDGEVVEIPAVGKCYPLHEQRVYAEQLCKFLNLNIAFEKGSRWRVVWTQPRRSYWNKLSGLFHPWVPELMECQYVDRDGDVQCVVDFEENVWDLLDNFSFTDVADLCNSAFEALMDIERDVGVRTDQKYSPSHGQKEVNPTVTPTDLF